MPRAGWDSRRVRRLAILSVGLVLVATETLPQSRADTLAVLEAAAQEMAAQGMQVGIVSPNPPCYRAACPLGSVQALSAHEVNAFAKRAGAEVRDLGDSALQCPTEGAGRCRIEGGLPLTSVHPPVFKGDSAVVELLQLLGGRQSTNGKRMVWERTVRVDLRREGTRWTVAQVRVTRRS